MRPKSGDGLWSGQRGLRGSRQDGFGPSVYPSALAHERGFSQGSPLGGATTAASGVATCLEGSLGQADLGRGDGGA